jgi:hypothetical protein
LEEEEMKRKATMQPKPVAILFALLLLALAFVATPASSAEGDKKEDMAALSTKAQDPLAKIISVPIFFNTYTDIGGSGENNYAMLVQPVVPFDIGSDDWYLMTRTIIPVVNYNIPDQSGIADTTLDIIFATNYTKNVRFGFGPIFQLPTHTDELLGVDRWGAGISGGAVLTQGRWVVGALATQIWDVAGSGDEDINEFTFQPIVNYDFGEKGHWVFTSTSLITANWDKADNKWDIPIGGGITKIFKFGKLPVSLTLQRHVTQRAISSTFLFRCD